MTKTQIVRLLRKAWKLLAKNQQMYQKHSSPLPPSPLPLPDLTQQPTKQLRHKTQQQQQRRQPWQAQTRKIHNRAQDLARNRRGYGTDSLDLAVGVVVEVDTGEEGDWEGDGGADSEGLWGGEDC